MPLRVELKEKSRRDVYTEHEREIRIQDSSDKGIQQYKANLENCTFKETEVNEMMVELIEVISSEVVMKTIKAREKRLTPMERLCKRKQNQLRRAVRKAKMGKSTAISVLDKRKEYRQACKTKQEEEKNRLIDEVKSIKNETGIWEFLNRKRRKVRMKISKKISLRDWKRYFQELLEGSETRAEEENPSASKTDNPETITKEDMDKAIKRLKKKKASGEDGTRNEAWIYASQEVKDRLLEIIQKVAKGQGFPEGWRRGVISPLYKKGPRDVMQNYRGIILLNTSYKIYALILEEKLRQETNEKNILPETQAGFRKKRSGIDNIFILNTAIEKELAKAGGTAYAFFVDFKAAFDTINRSKLWNMMERLGIRQSLVDRLKEIYEVTQNVVRVEGATSPDF